MNESHFRQLLCGSVETLVLKALSGGALHVYGIKKMMYDRSDGYLGLAEGRLYPLLRQLESRGFVCGREAISSTGRRVREYSLTQAGRGELDAQIKAWSIFSHKMNQILD
jgi:DNA-binding PadR family transcriptional regulator